MAWIITGISLGIALIATYFAIASYRQLWRWARQCQYARIVVAHKNRVRLNAPLVEWLLWCNQLDNDKDANGRMIYSLGGTSVSIIKKSMMPEKRLHKIVKSVRPTHKRVASTPKTRVGSWSATDQTRRP